MLRFLSMISRLLFATLIFLLYTKKDHSDYRFQHLLETCHCTPRPLLLIKIWVFSKSVIENVYISYKGRNKKLPTNLLSFNLQFSRFINFIKRHRQFKFTPKKSMSVYETNSSAVMHNRLSCNIVTNSVIENKSFN